MKYLLRFSTLFTCLLIVINNYAQSIEPSILKKQWTASWIAVPEEGANSYGVYLFRKNIELSARVLYK